jgi:putative CocE/NonD family hydrolase
MDDIRVVTEFPRKVREIENAWIPMPDGTRLAARIWLPVDAKADPVPAILEYLPYRKRDLTAERDALTHPYFAGHGYAGVRVDMRGSGDSEGLCKGEYLEQEQTDCLAVIEWLASQSWCSGAVGMIGISWGGFNGLQVAALRPKALKAIVTVCSTDDRYADDIHYLGGAMHGDQVVWGATAWAISMTPPDPTIVGPDWRRMWEERLNGNGIWLQDWIAHQRRDDFYRHGSVCENYADIEIPVYAVGGWVDGYPNAIFRLIENLPGPRKALIGPWGHKYPHYAMPGPRIGFLQECLRWWDQHLKGLDTGIMDEPMLRAWMQDPVAPAPIYDVRPGRWVAEESWPSASISDLNFGLARGLLTKVRGSKDVLALSSPATAGMTSGAWCGYGSTPMLPLDQRAEAGAALVFDSEPLAKPLEILGLPELEVVLECDMPAAILSASLSALATDGSATRVAYGVLNLSHRNDDFGIAPMMPQIVETVCLKLRCCGQRFEAGQRIRLAIATSYWPIVFPTPKQPTLRIHCAGTSLTLPRRTPQALDALLVPFGPPETSTPLPTTQLVAPRPFRRQVTTDQITGEVTTYMAEDTGLVRLDGCGMRLSSFHEDSFTVHPDDPATAQGTSHWIKTFGRGDWQTRVDMTTTMRGLADVWRLETHLVATHGDQVVLDRAEVKEVPRDLN